MADSMAALARDPATGDVCGTPSTAGSDAAGGVLSAKREGGAQIPRFSSAEEFEAFWRRLEDEAQAGCPSRESVAQAADTAQAVEAPGASHAEQSPSEEASSGEGPYNHLRDVIDNRPLARELMRRTLGACLERQPYGQVEQDIQGYPEFSCAAMTPYQVISALVDADGLRRVELDERGDEILPEMKAGLTDDEADDLVAFYALETTDLGRIAYEDTAPALRLADLFACFADRRGIFAELMSFCEEKPRSYRDIEALFEGRDFSSVATLNPVSGAALQPSVFVDSLERAGGLVWRDGWRLTNAGAALLDALATGGYSAVVR